MLIGSWPISFTTFVFSLCLRAFVVATCGAIRQCGSQARLTYSPVLVSTLIFSPI